MTLKQALAIFAANHAITEGSFVYALHERDTFDRPTFWALYNAMIIIGAAEPSARPKHLRRDAFWVYRNILMSVIWHFDLKDAAYIKRLPKQLNLYFERIEWAFHPVINGEPGYRWDADFGKELRNPLQDELERYFRVRRLH